MSNVACGGGGLLAADPEVTRPRARMSHNDSIGLVSMAKLLMLELLMKLLGVSRI